MDDKKNKKHTLRSRGRGNRTLVVRPIIKTFCFVFLSYKKIQLYYVQSIFRSTNGDSEIYHLALNFVNMFLLHLFNGNNQFSLRNIARYCVHIHKVKILHFFSEHKYIFLFWPKCFKADRKTVWLTDGHG